LESLSGQDVPPAEFQVVVVDDGSTDDTKSVVLAFADQLDLVYHFQDDLGYRVATARNAGARLAAAPLLAFLDSGTLAGPAFVRRHLEAHSRGESAVVLGYCYGYQPYQPVPGLLERIVTASPLELVTTYGDEPAFRDLRHERLSECGFDLSTLTVPWRHFWSMNFSLAKDTFRSVEGFDETFRDWGVEDLELGYRLHTAGVPLRFDRDAWAVEAPHERAVTANLASGERNAWKFLELHPEPAVEVFLAHQLGDREQTVESEYRQLLAWADETRGLTVAGEVERALEDLPSGCDRIAVIGCGGALPASLPGGTLIDFDRVALDTAVVEGASRGRHALGVHTGLPDAAFDAVVITSRLRGLWPSWGQDVLTEAHRIGKHVWCQY